MQEYNYSLNCILDKNKPQSMWNVNNPEFSVWSGTYQQNNQAFTLTNNSSTVAQVTIALIHHLQSQQMMNFMWKNNVLTGSFKLEWNDNNVNGKMEMKNHSFHITGPNYDKWGGNHSKMIMELARISGCENNDFKLIYNDINATVTVYPWNNSNLSVQTQTTNKIAPSNEKPTNKIEIVNVDDTIGNMFNIFGDDEDDEY